MRGLIGEAGAVSLQALLASVNRPTDGLVATLFGLGLMLVGATTVFAELQDTLDHIWRAPARPASGLWSLLRARVLSFGLILGVSAARCRTTPTRRRHAGRWCADHSAPTLRP